MSEANFLTQPRGYYPAVQELLGRTDVRGLRSRDYTEDVTPDHESTLTLVLLPYHKGKVSPRYRTKGGKPLGTFEQPMIVEGFTVKEVGNSYEVVVGELVRYPELQELADQDNRRQERWNYIIDWDDKRGVPIKFGSRPLNGDNGFSYARALFELPVDLDFGERFIMRGLDLSPPESRLYSVYFRPTSSSGCKFRLVGK